MSLFYTQLTERGRWPIFIKACQCQCQCLSLSLSLAVPAEGSVYLSLPPPPPPHIFPYPTPHPLLRNNECTVNHLLLKATIRCTACFIPSWCLSNGCKPFSLPRDTQKLCAGWYIYLAFASSLVDYTEWKRSWWHRKEKSNSNSIFRSSSYRYRLLLLASSSVYHQGKRAGKRGHVLPTVSLLEPLRYHYLIIV